MLSRFCGTCVISAVEIYVVDLQKVLVHEHSMNHISLNKRRQA